jgi:predicted transposase YbfD/YdcC
VKPLPPLKDKPVNVHHERNHLKDDDVAKWLSGHDAAVMTVEQERSRRRNERQNGCGVSIAAGRALRDGSGLGGKWVVWTGQARRWRSS